MKKIIICCIPLILIIGVVATLKLYPYGEKDKQRISNILLEKKKARLYDMVRLDLNNDGKITLYDMLLVQKKINKGGK